MFKLSPLAWVYVAIAVGCALLLGVVKYQEGRIEKLNQTVGTATVVVEAANTTLDLMDLSSKIDDKAVITVIKKEQEVKATVDKRIQTTHNKVEKTIADAALLPDTAENKTAVETEVSRVRVTSLWDAYCAAKPSGTGCPVDNPTEQEKQNDQ